MPTGDIVPVLPGVSRKWVTMYQVASSRREGRVTLWDPPWVTMYQLASSREEGGGEGHSV